MREQNHAKETPDIGSAESGRDIERQRMSRKTSSAPALALEIILRCLDEFYIVDIVYKFHQQDSALRRFDIRCQQIGPVGDIRDLSGP
jgi:hypothetical protein